MRKKKSRKVLVVSNDPQMADFFAGKKTLLDYESIKVSNGELAFQVAAKQSPFDLLIADILTPEINGEDFADKFTKLYPKTDVLYMIS